MGNYAMSDYERMKEDFLRRTSPKGQSDPRWWRPEKNKQHKFRLLPPKPPMSMWYLPYGIHYRVFPDRDNPTETCPKLTMGQQCYICERVRALWRDPDERAHDLAREIKGVQRYVANVLVLSSDTPTTPRMFAFGQKIYEQICPLFVGENGIVPIDDLERGHNLFLTVGENKGADRKTGQPTSYPKYAVTPEMQSTRISDVSILQGMHDITAEIHGKVRSYAEVQAEFAVSAEPPQGERDAVESPVKPVHDPTAPANAVAPGQAVDPRVPPTTSLPVDPTAPSAPPVQASPITSGATNAEPQASAAPVGQSAIERARALIAQRRKQS